MRAFIIIFFLYFIDLYLHNLDGFQKTLHKILLFSLWSRLSEVQPPRHRTLVMSLTTLLAAEMNAEEHLMV